MTWSDHDDQALPVTPDRERQVSRAFVGLASNLANGDDIVELLDGLVTDCARLLDVSSVGLLLANPRGVLHVLAATSQASHDIELLQLQNEEGPCLDCFQNGTAISVADLGQETHRWPRFAPAALDAGFSSVHALPMRLRANILGVMGLFGNTPGALNDDDLSLGQALADVASVSIVQDQAATDRRTLAEQLQNALNSRVLIEQAKGLIAQIGNLDMLQSLAVMQRFARDRHQRLTRVAAAVVSRELSVRVLLDHAEQAGRLQG